MTRNVWKIAFGVSAGLNLVFAVAAVAALVAGTRLIHAGGPGTGFLGALIVSAERLPPAQAERWRASLRQAVSTSAPGFDQARSLRRQTWREMKSETFDPAKAKADLAKARALDGSSRARVEGALVDFAATLPAAERKALAEGVTDALRKRRGPPRLDR